MSRTARLALSALLVLPPLDLAAQTRLACPHPGGAPLWHQALCELSEGIEEREDRFLPGREPSIWHASQFRNMAFLDWKTETVDVLAQFDEMLTSTGAPPLPLAQRTSFLERGKAAWGKSTPLDELSVPLAQAVSTLGRCLLYIDTGSDSYGFAVVTPVQYARWADVTLGEYVHLDPVSDDVQYLDYSRKRRASPRAPEEAAAFLETQSDNCSVPALS